MYPVFSRLRAHILNSFILLIAYNMARFIFMCCHYSRQCRLWRYKELLNEIIEENIICFIFGLTIDSNKRGVSIQFCSSALVHESYNLIAIWKHYSTLTCKLDSYSEYFSYFFCLDWGHSDVCAMPL